MLLGGNYGRFLNIPGFRVCQVSAYATVAQGSEYAWSMFHRVLNELAILNMPGLRILQGCKYARVTQTAEYA